MPLHTHLLRLFLLALLVVPPLRAQTDTSKINIAVMTLNPGAGLGEAEMAVLSDRLSTELFRTGAVNVMERNQIQSILIEQGFQQSGSCSDEACLVEAGQLLGVQQLISGSVGSLGSLYLVNLRVIDVSSAQIVHVVSDDIKGSIENVVERLPIIAQRLVTRSEKVVAAAPVSAAPVATAPVAKAAPVAPPPVATPASAAPIISPPVPGAAAVVPIVVKERGKGRNNKNRAGVRLLYQVSPGMPQPIVEGEKAGAWLGASYSYSALRRTELLFLIKAGPFLNISVGPSFSNQTFKCKLLDAANTELNFDFSAFSVESGISFVKRWYPLKVDAGILLGFNLLFGNSTLNSLNLTYPTPADYATYEPVSQEHNYVGAGTSLGFRGGAELMIGPHVSIGTELVFRPIGSTSMKRNTPVGNSESNHFAKAFNTTGELNVSNPIEPNVSYDPSFDPGLPKVGFGLSVTFYFGS
jgi:TolB-like protein